MAQINEVVKRNGDVVEFEKKKLYNAIEKANNETEEISGYELSCLVDDVIEGIVEQKISVEDIQDIIEDTLMRNEFTKTAKAYILYRDKKNNERKPDIFRPRKNYRPFEYPELFEYGTAVQQSFWLFSEYNYNSSVQDYHVNVEPHERTAIKNAMLAISQVEVTVKNYWGSLASAGFGNSVPIVKPEISSVAAIFAESEVRHSEAYSHLLTLLGLDEEFENYQEIPALNNRVKYLESYNRFVFTGDKRDYTLSMILFSAFIENISLFSQFLIMMSFNKHKNLFSGLSNAIEATSKEESLHFQFGASIVNIIKEENPEFFDDEMAETVYGLAKEAYESEQDLLNWIFEDGELDFLPKKTINEFIKNRLNESLESIGLEHIFDVDEEEVEKTTWFNVEILGTKQVDFFSKR